MFTKCLQQQQILALCKKLNSMIFEALLFCTKIFQQGGKLHKNLSLEEKWSDKQWVNEKKVYK